MAPAVKGRARPPARRRLRWVGLASVVMVSVAAGLWPWYHRPAQILAALPSLPELTGKPVELSDLIAGAVARIRPRSDPLTGLQELGSVYHANGFSREAAACWELLILEQPRSARWRYLLADAQRQLNDYAAMAAALEKVTALDPTYAPAWLKLADYQLKIGQSARAATNYSRHAALLPGDPVSALGLIRVALQQGDSTQARQWLDALVQRAPRFSPAQNLFAEILAASGETALARRHRWLGREAGRYRAPDDPWLDELENRCRDPQMLQLAAAVAFQTGRREQGRTLLERAVKLAPADPSLRAALGKLHLDMGNPAEARTGLIAGLGLPSQARPSIAYFVHLSQACRLLGRADEAVHFTRQGLALHPASHELTNALGQAWESLRQPEAAIEAYRQAVALHPSDAECNFNLATMLILQERFGEARDCLRRSLTLQPTFPKSLKLLAKLELAAERADAAAEYLEPLYDAQCGDPQVRELMVEWKLLAGRREEARQVLQEGVEIARVLGDQAEAARCEAALRQLPL